MTADDYMAWANEYWQDAEAAEHLYNKYKAKLAEHTGSLENCDLHRKINMYYYQMISLRAYAKKLEKYAEQVRKENDLRN